MLSNTQPTININFLAIKQFQNLLKSVLRIQASQVQGVSDTKPWSLASEVFWTTETVKSRQTKDEFAVIELRT